MFFVKLPDLSNSEPFSILANSTFVQPLGIVDVIVHITHDLPSQSRTVPPLIIPCLTNHILSFHSRLINFDPGSDQIIDILLQRTVHGELGEVKTESLIRFLQIRQYHGSIHSIVRHDSSLASTP